MVGLERLGYRVGFCSIRGTSDSGGAPDGGVFIGGEDFGTCSSGEVLEEEQYPSTSARATQSQVEWSMLIERHGSEETVSGRASIAARAGIRML